MAAQKAVTAAAWATAERQYADHSIKVSDIAKRLGLSSIELSNAAKDRGWPLRSSTRATHLSGGAKKDSRKTRNTSPSPLGERAGVRGRTRSDGQTAPSSGLRPPSPQGEKERGAGSSTQGEKESEAGSSSKGEKGAPTRLPAGSAKRSRQAQAKTLPAGSRNASRKAQAKPLTAGSTKEGRNAQIKNPVLLVQRVYATIDGELNKLEKQEGKTSQDRERASRALSQITNSLEKAVEMQRDIKKAMTKAGGRHDKEALAHAEDLRRAIAERLERLQRQRSLGKRSGGAE